MHRSYFIRFVIMGILLFALAQTAYAQPTVKIILVAPDIRNHDVRIGDIAEIKFIARIHPPGLQTQWTLVGPGHFDGDTQGLAAIYIVPQTILGQSATVAVHITGTDEQGNTARDSVQFTVLSPSKPSEQPFTPTPTATPTVPAIAPSPMSTVRMSTLLKTLQQADTYFQRQQYTTPENANAFTLYQDVLRQDPANQHARQKIRQMAEIYTSWGEDAYQQRNYGKAEMYYQRAIMIARYMQDALNDSSMLASLQALANQREHVRLVLPTPVSIAQQPTATPVSQPTATLDNKQLRDLERTLSDALTTYTNLKEQEKQGRNRNPQIIAAAREIIQTIIVIEKLLDEQYRTSSDQRVLKKRQDYSKTRQTYEQELLDRLIVQESQRK